MKMQKAIAVIQFKLEGRLIKEHPEYKMDNRLMLDKINIKNGSVAIDGKSYAMRDLSFPTVDFNEPYTLTKQEQLIIDKLRNSFINCKRLREHIKLLLNKGGLYKVCNNNLLFHGRDKMTTFERYFVDDKSTYTETKDPYYSFINDETTVKNIFKEFNINSENAHIINGHVPIHHTHGESPIKCGGKVIIIDGGFSQPYHKVTGIAGYTLIYNSYGLMLTAHQPFKSVDYTIQSGKDMETTRVASQVSSTRILVGDTDTGKKIKESINDLKELIEAYRNGTVKQAHKK